MFIKRLAIVSTGWKPNNSRIPEVPEPSKRAVADSLLLPEIGDIFFKGNFRSCDGADVQIIEFDLSSKVIWALYPWLHLLQSLGKGGRNSLSIAIILLKPPWERAIFIAFSQDSSISA